MMRILIIMWLVLFASVTGVAADQTVEELKKAIEATTDKAQLGRLYKQLGDHYATQDKLAEAAEAYLKALSLARGNFSLEERRVIAVRLSWAGRVEAIAELRDILAQDPGNVPARNDLTRILSWRGELSAAIEEADRVLQQSPGNRDALLVKADALRWRGEVTAAIPIYRRLLKEKDDFNARLGLSYALLAVGDIKGSQETSRELKPEFPYQERDLQGFREAERAATRPTIDLRYSHYSDSDDNRVNQYTLSSGFWVENWKLTLSLRHTDADDPRRDVRAEDLTIRGVTQLTERFRIRGGVGVTQLGNGETTHVPTGSVGAEARILRGTVGAGVSREAITDIAKIIQNEVKVVDAQGFASQQLTDRLSIYGEVHYRDYSDDNHAVDASIAPTFAIYTGNPTISIGYRFRYLDFDHQSTSGYFDPQDYVAHQGVGSISLTLKQFYVSAEVFGGHQRFSDPAKGSATFKGGGGTLGFRPTTNLLLEINGTTSNAPGPGGGAPGFSSFTVGARLLYTF